ncbi:MAG: hypothetical protein V1798_08165 [Pseudomonadota bacterium]
MNSVRSADNKPPENHCPNCGLKKSARPDIKAEPRVGFEFSSPEYSEASRISKPKKNPTTSKVKKRIEKAKHFSELRQISKELASRLGDLEIQISRRLEDLQALSVRLTQVIENEDD